MEKLFILVGMLLHLKRMKCSKERACMGSTVGIFFPLLAFVDECFWGMHVGCREKAGIISVSLPAWRCAYICIFGWAWHAWDNQQSALGSVYLRVCRGICFSWTICFLNKQIVRFCMLFIGGQRFSSLSTTTGDVCKFLSYTQWQSIRVCVRARVHALGQCQHGDLLPSSSANYTRALKAT